VRLLTFVANVVLGATLAGCLAGCGGCGKKKDDESNTAVPPPPPRGGASGEELTTLLGSARGLDEGLAPTSVRWTRAFALDDKRALIAGELVNETIAIITDDGGATWRSLRNERDAWSGWAVTTEGGGIVVAAGAREGAPSPTTATIAATKVAFATFEAPTLSAPTPVFPTAAGPVPGVVQIDSAVPAMIGLDAVALVGSEGPKKSFLIYGGKPGAEAVAPLKLPANEKIVPVPYGRPPTLLSIKGKELVERPFPAPGKPLDKPTKVPLGTTATTLAELSLPPACESGSWSFQRVKQAKGIAVLGVSQDKTVLVPVPEATSPTSRVGCGAGGRVVVEIVAPKAGAPATWATQPDIPSMASCDLAGKCVMPQNAPFRVWPEKHTREITMAMTEKGVLGVMSARAGDRWGLYLAQGPGDGAVYERQRPIGEGQGDRGRLELGALVSLGKRAILLVSADVTGTSRRGWFVMVSDDGGTNWGPP
jgi:hypothetical protein